MLVENLKQLVSEIKKNKAEGRTIELKKAAEGCPGRLYGTLSSFSNQDEGGIIIFGIDEKNDFAVQSVYDLQDLQQKVTEQCKEMEPPVRALFTTAEIEGKKICSAEIPPIDISERPCYYKGAGKYNGSYIRVGDADLKMTDYEIYSLDAYRKHIRDDERVVERADERLLDASKVEDYIRKKTSDRPGFSQMEKDLIYEMLNIYKDGKPTLAAYLNFGYYSQGFFPQYAVIAIVVPGDEIGDVDINGERFLDNKRIEGTISEMVSQTTEFCRRNMRVRTIINPLTGGREDKTEYPLEAVREAVINALIHRDYSIHTEGTAVQFNMFYDRLEIHSPGNLYGRMTVDQLGEARPDLRNPSLVSMAESQMIAENRYSGIPTMRRKMKEYGLPEPIFENRRNEFVVTFYNREKLIRNNQTYAVLADGENIDTDFFAVPRTREEILENYNLSTWSYAKKIYIDPMLREGKLAMTIPDKPRSRNQKYIAVRSE